MINLLFNLYFAFIFSSVTSGKVTLLGKTISICELLCLMLAVRNNLLNEFQFILRLEICFGLLSSSTYIPLELGSMESV